MITLLKLGGSLITDKNKAHTARPDVIRRLAKEIKEVWLPAKEPLVIGHGSGSFGHIPAKSYNTRSGVFSKSNWAGFAEVHAEATSLNRIVIDILREEGLPVLSIVPMDSVRTKNGKVIFWDTSVIEKCLENELIPVVFGDTVFDSGIGGTILSTEDLFFHLCSIFSEPPRILLAGLEDGVWRDFPKNTELIQFISADGINEDSFIQGSASIDVTGGMNEKVRIMKNLIRDNKACSSVIFSGLVSGNLKAAYNYEKIGTQIC